MIDAMGIVAMCSARMAEVVTLSAGARHEEPCAGMTSARFRCSSFSMRSVQNEFAWFQRIVVHSGWK